MIPLLLLLLGCAPKRTSSVLLEPCQEGYWGHPAIGTERQLELLADMLSRDLPPELREEILLRMGKLSREQASCLEEYPEERSLWLKRSVAAYQRFLRENPGSARADEALYGLGLARMAQGNPEAARAAWERLLAEHPASPLRPYVLSDLPLLSPDTAPPP